MNRLQLVAVVVVLAACSSHPSPATTGAPDQPLPGTCDAYLAELRSCFARQQREPAAIEGRIDAQRAAFARESDRDALAVRCSANARQLEAACQ